MPLVDVPPFFFPADPPPRMLPFPFAADVVPPRPAAGLNAEPALLAAAVLDAAGAVVQGWLTGAVVVVLLGSAKLLTIPRNASSLLRFLLPPATAVFGGGADFLPAVLSTDTCQCTSS